ncbi:uncharacterized protein LOC142541134 isoform X7 [Primulina tabacum]|uniref:uncharacterized protein LOC142541134 isoform X7 n=1 Tax=Primulina tabacum TaxID=48773 RepID=UPI003F5AADBA
MPYSRRPRYSLSPSPYKRYSRSISQSPSRSMSGSRDSSDAENPGNNLYVTGLSTRVSWRDLEKHFSSEGKVEDVRLVVDPWTQESRGFGFVTMSTVGDADRCVKYLDRSVLQGRVISVEKGSCVQQLFSKLTNQIEYNEQISDCYFEGCMPCISFFLQLEGGKVGHLRPEDISGRELFVHVADLPIREVFLRAIHLKERGVAAGHTLLVIIVDTITAVHPIDVGHILITGVEGLIPDLVLHPTTGLLLEGKIIPTLLPITGIIHLMSATTEGITVLHRRLLMITNTEVGSGLVLEAFHQC